LFLQEVIRSFVRQLKITMIEIDNADIFIKNFETVYHKRLVRIPYTTKEGKIKTLLMCKCGRRWIALPYFSIAILENRVTDRHNAPFKLFESEDGNIISAGKASWEIRDTMGHSPYIYSDKILPVMCMDYEDNLWNKFPPNVKRKIRKAYKNNIKVEYGTDKRILNKFYQAYIKRMREIGVMPVGKSLINKKVRTGQTTLFVASVENKIIGGATLNKMDDKLFENEFFATIEQYNHLYTSYILHYSMLCFAKQEKARFYSFGRSTINSSVHQYKKHWKAPESVLYWSYSQKHKNIRDRKILHTIWKKIPYGISSFWGPILSKYVY